MRLQSLYIKGFKSFANETILHFNDDVIGVVGPNGSGKSNIVDAIRWVLGEQKGKDLRLESMSDVIFNGTKKRKEAAAAIVSLTFENNRHILPVEYNTVTISRILYRNGESEYRINNVICRLKDINTLFMDTGIGSNSYAIIVLGMVDDILADKENARRRMFEQAAGISKFKIRKRETLNKLKSAEEDLNRVEDLLFEIDSNLKVLEKQAKRTKKYNELREQYKNLSITYAIHSIQSLKEEYKQTSEQIRQEQDKYKSMDAELYTLHAALEKEKKKHVDKEEEVSQKQKSLAELVSNIRNIENEKNLTRQNIGFKQQTLHNLKIQIESDSGELKKLLSETEALQERILAEQMTEHQMKDQFRLTETAYNQAKSEYNAAKQSFDQFQLKKQSLDRLIFDNEKSTAILQNTIDNLNKENQRMSEDLENRKQSVADLKSSSAVTEKEIVRVKAQLDAFNTKEEDRKQTLKQLESEKEALSDKLKDIHRRLDSRQHEHDLLKSMVENYEGFPESVKFLGENWNKNAVLLSDVIQVEDRYRTAIEQHLEQYLNYFVVSDEVEAKAAIRLLRDGQHGKANFFLLNKVPDVKTVPYADSEIKSALEVIKTQDKYLPLVKWLLQDVYLTEEELDTFRPVETLNEDIVYISASGTFQKTRLSYSGGSVGLFEGKRIGRKQNLEKLAVDIEKLTKSKMKAETDMLSLQQRVQQVRAADMQKDIDSLNAELAKLQQAAMKLALQLDNFEKMRKEVEDKISSNNEQIKLKSAQIEKLREENTGILHQIQEISGSITSDDQHINALYRKMTECTEAFNTENIRLIRHQNLLENLSRDLDFKHSRSKEIEAKISQSKLRIASEEKQMIDLSDQVIQMEEQLKNLYTEKEGYQSTLSEAEQSYFQARAVINELEEKIRQLTRLQNQVQNHIQQLKDKFTECKFRINAVGERLKIEFDIQINDIINAEPEPIEDLELLGQEVEKLRNKLQTFGEINPMALEAYNEMHERFTVIQTQRQDILDARNSLEDTIKEIENTATQKFTEAFGKVRENFIKVFRSLFTEDDTCDLVLLDPANPLESEIEIIAKPKGKKPKSLSQLSGGEKTLTATALLFALYLLKPAPFCIFDEVDAPLDDANIQKFNNIIKTFSKDSQFIIVTHNKATMAEVDILYGVYMDEPGVSSVSAVDFRSFRHEPILQTVNGTDI